MSDKKSDIRAYQKRLSSYGLYSGKIDGIFGPKTTKADSLYKKLVVEKEYSKSQVKRYLIGAPHMSDAQWSKYIRSGKIEDSIIDSMKKQ